MGKKKDKKEKKDKKLKKAAAKAMPAAAEQPAEQAAVAADDAAAKPATTMLAHVNVPYAQTWNYLRINDIAFEVPTPDAKGKVYEAAPRLFDAVDAGVGEEAARWIVASAGDVRYVEVPRHTVRTEPVVVNVSAGQAANTAIMVREGATVSVVVVATSGEAEPGTTTAALTRIIAERDATVDLVEIVADTDATAHLEGVGIKADDRATVNVRQYALGGAKVAFGIGVELAGDYSRLDLLMRYHASGEGTLDVNHQCRMSGSHSRAEMHASGVLADAAKKTMRETIDLVHGAKDARGNEAETVLVTGDDVVNKTLPTILCDEEDVQGNHGATIGSIGPDQLNYLADRGLSREEAESLFVRAIFDDAIIHASVPEAHDAAVARAEAVLGADVAHDLDQSQEA